MREFQQFDIEILRGIKFEIPAEIRDSDGSFVPLADVATPVAYLTAADSIDAARIATMAWDVIDGDRTTLKFYFVEASTASMIATTALYWFSTYVDRNGETVPIYRGRAMVR